MTSQHVIIEQDHVQLTLNEGRAEILGPCDQRVATPMIINTGGASGSPIRHSFQPISD